MGNASKKTTSSLLLVMLASATSLRIDAGKARGAEERIEVKAGEFHTTRYLSEKQRAEIKRTNLLTGYGEAEYAFRIPRTGWYELWVESCSWSTDLLLDGRLLTHTTFTGGEWKPDHNAEKVLNLYLAAGDHTLRFVRPWPPGLPYLRRFFFEPARDATGMVRLAPKKDYMVFRRGEEFPLQLQAGRLAAAYDIHLALVDPETNRTARQWTVPVPAGEGLLETALDVATDRAGVFDLHVRDAAGAADGSDRAVRGDRHPIAAGLPGETGKGTRPGDRLRRGRSPIMPRVRPAWFSRRCGAYRESGTRGRFGQQLQADSFAYTLKLPSIQEPYLATIDYPDDDQRTFTIALIERAANPYAPTAGVASGGVYSLSGQMQPHELFFYPAGRTAAAARAELVSRPAGGGGANPRLSHHGRLSLLCGPRPQGRMVGMWQEEPMRVTGNYGAMPTGDAWPNVLRPVERMAQLSNYVGANLYEPTIAVYQTKLWPSRQLPTFGVESSILGPGSLKDPLQKDLFRLILLTAERHRMNVVGQLFITPQTGLSQYLDRRFGGDGDAERLAAGDKPWLLGPSQRQAAAGLVQPALSARAGLGGRLVSRAGRSLQGFARLQGRGHPAHGMAVLLLAGDPLDQLRL